MNDLQALKRDNARNQSRLVVSLTCGYELRLQHLHHVMKSLREQTRPADLVVLYLPDRFHSIVLPESLEREKALGLSIEYVEDLGSATKLLYALKQYPDDLIVTIDDDLIYSRFTLKNLYSAHLKYPDAVVANRTRTVQWSGDMPEPYSQWLLTREHFQDPYVLPTGVAGVLYPGGVFEKEVHDVELLRELSLTNDDLWFDIHRRRGNAPAYRVANATTLEVDVRCGNAGAISDTHLCHEIEGSQEEGLWRQNVDQQYNDRNFNSLLRHYEMGKNEFLAHPLATAAETLTLE